MARLKDLCQNPELFSKGHRACAGCGEALAVRQILLAAPQPVVGIMPTGCLEIFSSIYPHSAWQIPMIHTAFETAASTASGVVAAYDFAKKKGRIKESINFIAMGGDGGTYDIGFQSLSGMLERGHRMLYICYNNEAYMNTVIQRSSATPKGARTNSSPAGKVIPGKQQNRKDLTACVIAHNVPYAAQASPHNHRDLMRKVEKALSMDGPSFLNIISPCPPGWEFKTPDTMKLARLAVETRYWPLFEFERGVYKVNYKPKQVVPVLEWLKLQHRFSHLAQPANQPILAELQAEVDRKWDELLRLEAMTAPKADAPAAPAPAQSGT
jgi:pyruvate ferredoxin oxidoreductase beta subunit